MPGDLVPVSEPIRDLRAAMERVRQMRDRSMGGLAIESAKYEAEAQPIEEKFIGDFLMLMPWDHQNDWKKYQWVPYDEKNGTENLVITPNPELALPTLAFGISLKSPLQEDRSRPLVGLPIGERVDPTRPALTDILFACDFGQKYAPHFFELTVDTSGWNEERERRLSYLAGTPNQNFLTQRVISGSGKVILRPSDLLQLRQIYRYYTAIQDPRNSTKRLWRRANEDRHNPDRLAAYVKSSGRIFTSAINNFNVLYNLEVIATAFGIEEQFDHLKAAREAALPKSAEERVFGLPNYRKTIEKGTH